MLGSRTSRWTAGTVALCLLLLVGFWFLLVGPRRTEAADLNGQRDLAVAANNALDLEIAQLQAQSAALPQRQAELARIKRQFPSQVQLPKLIRDLDTFATQSGVSLDGLTPGAPVAVGGTGTAAAAGGAPAAAGGTSAAAGQPAQPQAGSASMLQVPVTIQVTGDYFQVATFVKRVQQMDRAALLTGTSIVQAQAADSDPGDVTTTLAGAVFVLPDSDTAATGTPQPAAPGAAGTGTTTQ